MNYKLLLFIRISIKSYQYTKYAFNSISLSLLSCCSNDLECCKCVKMRFSLRKLHSAVVSNLLHAATHFDTQFANDPLPKICSQAYVMQLCLHKRKSQRLILKKNAFIKFMHLAASMRETRAVYESLHRTTQ